MLIVFHLNCGADCFIERHWCSCTRMEGLGFSGRAFKCVTKFRCYGGNRFRKGQIFNKHSRSSMSKDLLLKQVSICLGILYQWEGSGSKELELVYLNPSEELMTVTPQQRGNSVIGLVLFFIQFYSGSE